MKIHEKGTFHGKGVFHGRIFLGKECRKILDPRRLLLIAVFTLLYYQMFMNLDDYPDYPYTASSPARWNFNRLLVEEIGPTLALNDWHLLEEKRKEFCAEAAEVISTHTVLLDAGIKDYDTWQKIRGELLQAESEEETSLLREVMSIYNNDPQFQQYIDLIQYIDNMDSWRQLGFVFGVPKTDAEALTLENYGAYATPLFLKANITCCQREFSLLPYRMTTLLWSDMRNMTILLIICSLILLVPHQISERLCGVTPLYAAAHIGRKIFVEQWKAELLSCGLVSALQLLVYLGMFAAKGLTVYWNCPAWPEFYNTFWLDISFGTYVILYLLMIWLFVMGNTVLAYTIGRCCANYIAGIAAAIPIGSLVCYLGRRLFNSPFAFTEYVRVPLWEPIVLAVWLAAMGGLLAFLFKRDQKRDL